MAELLHPSASADIRGVCERVAESVGFLGEISKKREFRKLRMVGKFRHPLFRYSD